MSVAVREVTPPLLTYEDYLAEGEVNQRYDIIDGVRIVTNPLRRHQRITQKLLRALEDYETATGRGMAVVAPSDVLITQVPLRTRQPDVLFISHERLAECAGDTDPALLFRAPEFVVEVLSPNESRGSILSKLNDYARVEVLEAWLVSPQAETIEVIRLATDHLETVAVYGAGQSARSVVLDGFEIPLSVVFAR